MKKLVKLLLWAVLAVSMVGCTTTRSDYASRADSKPADRDNRNDMSRSGAHPVTFDAVETINLLYLIDPEQETRREQVNKGRNWEQMSISEKYDLGFASFAQLHPASQLKSRRDLVQNRLIMASERRCARYIQYLKKDQSDTNFGFGIATTVLSGLGALVPGLRGAQNLSGASAMVSGIQAGYNNEYFANLAVSVISRGIEERRLDEMNAIQMRQRDAYAQYDIAAAVADAVRYDGLCNVVAGLEKANEAITKVAEPGADAVNRSLMRSQLTRALASNDNKQVQSLLDTYAQLGVNTTALANSLVYAPRNQSPVSLLAATRATGGLADFFTGLEPYAAALQAEKRIRASLATVPDRVSATLVELKASTTITAAIAAGASATMTVTLADFDRSFVPTSVPDGTTTKSQTTSCYGEAKLLGKELADAARVVQDAEAERLAGKGGEAKIQLATDKFNVVRGKAARFDEKMFRYQTAVARAVDEAVARVKEPLGKLVDEGLQLRWAEIFSSGIGESLQCSYKP